MKPKEIHSQEDLKARSSLRVTAEPDTLRGKEIQDNEWYHKRCEQYLREIADLKESHKLELKQFIKSYQEKIKKIKEIIKEECKRIRNIPEFQPHHKFAKEFTLTSLMFFIQPKIDKIMVGEE